MPVPALIAAMDALLMMQPPPLSFMYRAARWAPAMHPEEVHAHDAGEILEVVGQEPLERAPDPGVVEHDVEPTEAVDGEVDQCLHLIRIAHIGLVEGGRVADARRRPPDPARRRRPRSRPSRPRPPAARRSPGRCPRHRRSRSPPSRQALVPSWGNSTVPYFWLQPGTAFGCCPARMPPGSPGADWLFGDARHVFPWPATVNPRRPDQLADSAPGPCAPPAPGRRCAHGNRTGGPRPRFGRARARPPGCSAVRIYSPERMRARRPLTASPMPSAPRPMRAARPSSNGPACHPLLMRTRRAPRR